MIVHRLTSRRFPTCNGEGARLYGGRWNTRGRAVVYTAGTQSLAALEILVHSASLANDYIVVSVDIPNDVYIERIALDALPDWKLETTGTIGDAWLTRRTSSALCVPSKVVPVEYNFVLNPAHPDFHHLVISNPEPFQFDRLLERLGRYK